MEQLTVFYRIFHADLSPTILPSIEQKKEYKEFLEHYSNISGYPVIPDISLLTGMPLRYYYYKVLLHKTVKEIKAELHHRIFVHGESEKQMKDEVIKFQRYINLHFQKIHSDFIPTEDHKISDKKDDTDIYRLVYSSLVDLHEYLEVYFLHYLDKHIIVPGKKRKQFIKQQKPNALLALKAVNNYKLHHKLKEQITSTIERFLNDGFNGFTYAQMDYCAKLNKELNQFFNSTLAYNEEGLIFLLIQINFNRNGILQYILAYIKEQLLLKENYCDQLEILSYCLKKVKRAQHPITFGYNEKLLSLKEQLCEWLEHKIYSISLKNNEVKNPKKTTLPIAKCKVNLSVPESALLIRLLKNSNIVDGSKEKLFDFFSNHFYTNHSPNVSKGSLDKKYDYPTDKNLKTVRKALHRCLSQLDEIETRYLR